jgi:hypothetical protein
MNVHGDLSMDPRNKYYPFERRPIDYFDRRYNRAKITLRKLQLQHRQANSLSLSNLVTFSKNYKKYLDRKNALETERQFKSEGKLFDKSSKEYKILQEYKKEAAIARNKKAEVRGIISAIKEFRDPRSIRRDRVRAEFDMHWNLGMRPELLQSPYDMFWFEKYLLDYYNFSWENLQFGLTITEIEKVLVIISFIRFCFYTLRYNAKSALIISLIGFISAILYQKMIVDAVGICYLRFYLAPSLFRLGFEQYLVFIHNERTVYHYSIEMFRWFDIYPGWLIRFIMNSPILSEIQRYVDNIVMPLVFKYIKIYRKPMEAMLFYTLILRVGKKYVPYPLQWHGIVYLMYCYCIGDFVYNRYVTSMEFLRDTLIPQLRTQEIEVMELLQTGFLAGFVYMIMLAMFHAVFSQYYYIPFLSQNIDAYIGKRPKDSILSGGYSSWQDEQELFIPSKGDYKIWFGFLGKGPRDKKRKRPRPPKISAVTNFLFLIIGLIIFYFMWSVQPDNLQSVRFPSQAEISLLHEYDLGNSIDTDVEIATDPDLDIESKVNP